MRNIFLIFALLFCLSLSGQSEHQSTVIYASDTPEKDSFFVLQTTYTPLNGRVDTLKDYQFFRDTNTLKNYRDNMRQRVEGLRQRIMFLRLEYDSLSSRSLELDTLVQEIIIFVRSETEHVSFEVIDQTPATIEIQFACFLTNNRSRRRRERKTRLF